MTKRQREIKKAVKKHEEFDLIDITVSGNSHLKCLVEHKETQRVFTVFLAGSPSDKRARRHSFIQKSVERAYLHYVNKDAA